MGTLKMEKTYNHYEDCRQSGCFGHTLSVKINTVSDTLEIIPDIKFPKQYLMLEPNQWKAIKEILKGWDYGNFDLNL